MKRSLAPVVLMVGLVVHVPALRAEAPPAPSPALAAPGAYGPLRAASLEAGIVAAPAVAQGGRRKSVLIGIVAGAGAAAAITWWAADRYGENEGGRFCTRCFTTWGAATIPAGGLAGAFVGALVGRDRSSPQRAPSTIVAPAIGRHAAAIRVAVRY